MKRMKPEGSILIGEDHPDTLHILRVIFESEGYSVDTVPESETVLVKALESKPLLVLLDIRVNKILDRIPVVPLPQST